jgi:NADPH2:quinone reductase
VQELLALHGRGSIRPLISARLSLARAADALALLASRQATGKIVVTMD